MEGKVKDRESIRTGRIHGKEIVEETITGLENEKTCQNHFVDNDFRNGDF